MEGFSHETLCFCALNRIFGFQPRLGRDLCTWAGGAPAVFECPRDHLRQVLGKDGGLADALSPRLLDETRAELERLDGTFLSIEDEGYPQLLLECPDPPLGVYVRSRSLPGLLFGFRPAVAVVGTRKVSPYGAWWCRKIVQEIAASGSGATIVSGLAFGTDRIAHETALQCGLPTIGVMATGIDDVYPSRHRFLAGDIVAAEGSGLLSDYPPGTAPVAMNFMRRNRLIAGLASATVVIESALKGGSLITARYANEYSRDVFALPGRIDDVRSAGCNRLIRDRMADIITDPASLVERLGFRPSAPMETGVTARVRAAFGDSRSPESLRLLEGTAGTVARNRGITVEGIAALSGRPYREIAEEVALLGAAGIVSVDILQQCTVNLK